MIKRFIIFAMALMVAVSCIKDSNNSGEVFDIDPEETEQNPDDAVIAQGVLDEIVKNFSNPVEMAALLKDVGAPFSKKHLCPTDKIEKYDTDFKKAVGLGLLSCDLGYLNIYEETGTIVSYITVIKKLADDLDVGQFFDFTTLKQLAINNDNLDSLMFLSVNSFNRMDDHLREHGRSNLSSLVITGVWMEGLYLATQVLKDVPNKELRERIGEQKIVLEDIYEIVGTFKSDKNFNDLYKDLGELKELYDQVQISYEIGEPEMIEKDGILTVIQKETSFVEITDEQLQKIMSKAEKIRNKLISL
ncbi:MAG TPA: hypothetical protein DCQ31_01000 [Bacteroidales bacterium]|nr:hypothetical protein [Bacteroidales bacterium]